MAARSPRSLAVVILAAGKGKRMKSGRPKVLHEVVGRPALWHVARAAAAARPREIVVVIGHGWEQVREAAEGFGLRPSPGFVMQEEPLGTGHAVSVAEPVLHDVDDVLVLAGDDPLVTPEQVREVLRVHRRRRTAATILTTMLDDPTGYGRVIRRAGDLVEIVEEADATPQVKQIREVSTLVYAFRREDLFRALPRVARDNRQHEYYLPDVLKVLVEKGERVSVVTGDMGAGLAGGPLGLNTRQGLSNVSRIMRARIVEQHLANGVTFVDPATAYIDVGVRIGPDTVVQPFTLLQGSTRIGSHCVVGPGSRIVDSEVADGAEVAFSVVRGSRIGPNVAVGPYASLRPGTVLEEGSKAGTFVEVKASRVGKRSKVPHLAYVGDAVIGEDANIGAGTVTVNYDGFDKHRTVVGDGAKVGSDTMLVAPVKVGKRAWTGAGSTITRDVPDGALGVERAEQRVVPGYDERRRAARAARQADAGGTATGRRRGGGSRG